MAATRAIRADLRDADASGPQVLERLQYRTVQSGKAQDESPPKKFAVTARDRRATGLLFSPATREGFGGRKIRRADGRPETESDGHRRVAELEQRLQEERSAAAQAVAVAREQGRREARQSVEQQINAEQQRLQAQILQSLEQFRLERQSYFHNVEGEVVRLALAIAARVLHREANLDPLLLSGAVRVALEKLGDSSHVVMRVPPREVEPVERILSRGSQSADSAGNPGGSFSFSPESAFWQRNWARLSWACERNWKKLKKAFSICWIAGPRKP